MSQKLEVEKWEDTEWENWKQSIELPDGSIVKIDYNQFLPTREHRQVRVEIIKEGRLVTTIITQLNSYGEKP